MNRDYSTAELQALARAAGYLPAAAEQPTAETESEPEAGI